MADHNEQFRTLLLKTQPTYVCHLLVKLHQAKDSVPEQPGTAIFAAGLPLGVDEDVLKEIFSCFGTVTNVALHATKRSCIVLFEDAAGARALLQNAGIGQVVEYLLPEPEGAYGLKGWVQEHKAQRPGNEVLQQQLDAWMLSFEESEKRKLEAQQSAMDEEGWTVVVKSKGRKKTREAEGGGKAAVATGGLSAAAAAQAGKDSKLKKHEDFYRFQQREKRRNELVDLRQQFDEDRKRVAQLRASRNFKPY